MKTILIALFSLFSLFAGAQFPVQQYTTIAQNAYEMYGVEYEGARMTLPSGYSFNGTDTPEVNGTVITNAGVGVGGFGVPITKALYINSVVGYSSGPVRININAGTGNGFAQTVFDGKIDMTLKKLVFGGQTVSANATGLLRPISAANKAVIDIQFNCFMLSNDFDFMAPYRMLVAGDSNVAFESAGGTVKEQAVHWLLKEWFANRADNVLGGRKRVQIIDKTYGGKTSSFGELQRNGGQFDVNDPGVMLYFFGTNDTDTTTYKSNVTKLIRWKKYRYPNMKLIVMGPGPRTGTLETTAANMRTAGQNAVTAAADPQIFFCNLGNAFSNVDDTYFTTTDGTSSTGRVHWNVAGHQKVFEKVRDFMITNNISF